MASEKSTALDKLLNQNDKPARREKEAKHVLTIEDIRSMVIMGSSREDRLDYMREEAGKQLFWEMRQDENDPKTRVMAASNLFREANRSRGEKIEHTLSPEAMAMMANLTGELERLREKYGDDIIDVEVWDGDGGNADN